MKIFKIFRAADQNIHQISQRTMQLYYTFLYVKVKKFA